MGTVNLFHTVTVDVVLSICHMRLALRRSTWTLPSGHISTEGGTIDGDLEKQRERQVLNIDLLN